MILHRVMIAFGLTILVSAPSWTAPVKTLTVTEEFDGTVEEASWRSDPGDVIVPAGGNPGGYLEADVIAAEPEIASTTPPFAATSYRNLGVTAPGIDLDLFDRPPFTEGRPVSLHLVSNNRTPEDPSDDCELVLVGKSLPSRLDAGWVSYDFRVPAWSDHLPSGWDVYGACAADPPDSAWLRVIGSVSRVSFHFGGPGVRYYPGRWIVIAAMSLNRVIGAGNRIPWHLPEDFKWFKRMTTRQVIVMGRKTFESIGKPLPNRTTLVLTRSPAPIPGVRMLSDLRQLDPADAALAGRQIYICGGAQVYRQALPLCSDLYLTLVQRVVEGDILFPPFEDQFELVAEEGFEGLPERFRAAIDNVRIVVEDTEYTSQRKKAGIRRGTMLDIEHFDFHLTANSPLIDAGSRSWIPEHG